MYKTLISGLIVGVFLLIGVPLTQLYNVNSQQKPHQIYHEDVPVIQEKKTSLIKNASESLLPNINAEELKKQLQQQNISFEDITYSPAHSQNKKTAILIPQTHKYPGSNSASAKNDKAEQIQRNILEILTSLYNKNDISLIMLEGDLAGEIPEEKISQITNDFFLLEDFKSNLNTVKDATDSLDAPKIQELLVQKGVETTQIWERDLLLHGAPYLLKAQETDDKPIQLVGAENQELKNKSADIVRDYMYIQDRLAQLEPHQALSSISTTKKKPTQQGSSNLSQSFQLSFDQIVSVSKKLTKLSGDNKLNQTIDEMDSIYHEFTSNDIETKIDIKKSTLPSRKNNPYNHITDINSLKKLLVQAEKNIEKVIVDERNTMTAENFSAALQDHNQTTGVLQFGAAHTDGLIDELTKQGISVITIYPTNQTK